MIYLGYDPGGADGKNGIAILTMNGDAPIYHVASKCSVNDAIAWLNDRIGEEAPVAAGIDAFLYWETDICGWREADLWLRRSYPDVENSVLSSNSTFGSMAIQGMAFAMRLRQKWPEIALIESHPKVLYYALKGERYSWSSEMVSWLQEKIGCKGGDEFKNDHEWDALISAWAAMMGQRGNWDFNLRTLLDKNDKVPDVLEPAGSVNYWWPREAVSDGRMDLSRGKQRIPVGKTTSPGYVNKHDQKVIRKTEKSGNDHNQFIYVLRCLECEAEYGSNGSDIHSRRCPRHDGGSPGLEF